MSSYGPDRHALLRTDLPMGGWPLWAHRPHSYRLSYTDHIDGSFINKFKLVFFFQIIFAQNFQIEVGNFSNLH
jgi:hypothetical protein